MTAMIPRPSRSWTLLAAALVLLPGCFNSSSKDASNVPGSGKARFYVETVEWGRLVDVIDSTGALAAKDVLIRETLTDGPNYTITINAITQSQVLTVNAVAGTNQFEALLDAARSGRAAVKTNGMSSPGPFSRVARNGAIRIQFSELLDPATVNRQTIQVVVGDPPVLNQEVRYIIDNSVIGADGQPKGVVIVDPTISRLDSVNLGIPENGVGLPASFDQETPNILLRIPTTEEPAFGQTMVLTNLGGNRGLEPRPSDPIEYSPLVHPIVVRAFRSGNNLDPFNGFMLDNQEPNLVGEFDVEITNVSSEAGNLKNVTYSIAASNCREVTPKIGDVFEVGNALLQVTRLDAVGNSAAYEVTGPLLFGAIANGNYGSNPLDGTLTSVYTQNDSQIQLCWVTFSPAPEAGLPARGVDPYSSLTVRFNEPIDVSTVRSLETMVLTSINLSPSGSEDPSRAFEPGLETVGDYIDRQIGFEGPNATYSTGSGSGRIKFGPVSASPDAREFTLAPSAGLTDAFDEGANMRLVLALRDSADGILDLAGNDASFEDFVAGNTGQAEIVTRGSFNPWPTEKYFALRFNSTDEDDDGLSEYIGQFVFDPGTLRGRDLVHFSRAADDANPYIGARIQFSSGIMTPLTPAGAVLQTVYGYHMLGLGLTAVSELNLDIEGLKWAPFGGSVFDDVFQLYSVALAHSERYPDDSINTQSGYPNFINSGLQRNKIFDENILGFPDIDEQVVSSGNYQISSVNLDTAITGTTVYPWPTFNSTYTWRDTDIPAIDTLDGPKYLGGLSGGGVPIRTTGQPVVYTAGNVPSIGLPLLMRFRAWPRGQFFGANGFQIQIMVGSSALPAFRVFSAGGRDSGGTWHLVIPDDPGSNGTQPSGGYNTVTGFPTKGYGPELYWGEVDFVVRISRVYTHWFSFGGTLDLVTNLTMEPSPDLQPPGTEVLVDFRGTTVVTQTNCLSGGPADDANTLDFYGNYDPLGCGSIATPTGWRSNIDSFISEYDWFQVRLTFVSNIQQDLSPELDAFGFAWNVE